MLATPGGLGDVRRRSGAERDVGIRPVPVYGRYLVEAMNSAMYMYGSTAKRAPPPLEADSVF